jgi:hypothetical protein
MMVGSIRDESELIADVQKVPVAPKKQSTWRAGK